VDLHSSWRFIRICPDKSTRSVLLFLDELKQKCPYPIVEIQTDNDTAFALSSFVGQVISQCEAVSDFDGSLSRKRADLGQSRWEMILKSSRFCELK
jgi:hypothetical protein